MPALGVLEAEKAGTPLLGVETQSGKCARGLPDWLDTPVRPPPFCDERMSETEGRRLSSG